MRVMAPGSGRFQNNTSRGFYCTPCAIAAMGAISPMRAIIRMVTVVLVFKYYAKHVVGRITGSHVGREIIDT